MRLYLCQEVKSFHSFFCCCEYAIESIYLRIRYHRAEVLSFTCFKFHHIGGQTFSPFHLLVEIIKPSNFKTLSKRQHLSHSFFVRVNKPLMNSCKERKRFTRWLACSTITHYKQSTIVILQNKNLETNF